MKLKQALVIGLSSAILAIPAFAAESATDLTSLPAANASQPVSVTPAKKEAFNHKKGHKKCLDAKQVKENAKLNELNTLNSSEAAKN